MSSGGRETSANDGSGGESPDASVTTAKTDLVGQHQQQQQQQQQSSKTTKTAENLSLWEASVWWLNSELLNSPGKVFCLASIPVLAGAYLGYKIPASTIEQYAGASPSTTTTSQSSSSSVDITTNSTSVTYAELDAETRAQRRALAVNTARRAFRVATMGTIGTFGLFGGIWFYVVQGYTSLDDAKAEWTKFGKRIQMNLEHLMGGDVAPSKSHPDVTMTRNMTDDEELKFVYDKYIRAAAEEENDNDQDKERYQPTGINGSVQQQQQQLEQQPSRRNS
jgi:hypothetical protein